MIPALILATLVGATPAKPKLVVLELKPAGDVDAALAGALSETVAAEAAGRGFFDVISSREIGTLIDIERQKQMMGCSEEDASCFAEITGALGARFVLSGTVARLGDAYQLSLQMIDSEKARTVGRATKLANDLPALTALVPWAVAEATGTPLPPPPSRVLQYSMIGAGGLLLVAGGIIGQDALSEAREVNGQLERGRERPGDLVTLAEYQARNEDLRSRGAVALGGVALGAALVAAGILTMPDDVPAASGVRVTLVPGTGGLAAVGSF